MKVNLGKTSLIIPAYFYDSDIALMTSQCLMSACGDKPDEVILVNDGSPPGNDIISTLQPLYSLGVLDVRIDRETNGGYSAAANDGLRAATGDVIIVGNNDLTFHTSWLTGLLKPLRDGYDIATCWTSDQDVKREYGIEDDAKFGSLFAMTRSAYERLGGFDEQFRGYFADLDYRNRALDMGLKIGKNLHMVVDHLAKATYKKTDPDDQEYLKAMRLYEIKHGEVD